MDNLPASSNILTRIRDEQSTTVVCNALKKYCATEWPAKNHIPNELLSYWQYKDNFFLCEGYLLYNSRLVIPPSLQLEMLSKIHEGHLGINKCQDKA